MKSFLHLVVCSLLYTGIVCGAEKVYEEEQQPVKKLDILNQEIQEQRESLAQLQQAPHTIDPFIISRCTEYLKAQEKLAEDAKNNKNKINMEEQYRVHQEHNIFSGGFYQ